jgi:hypothetical protein
MDEKVNWFESSMTHEHRLAHLNHQHQMDLLIIQLEYMIAVTQFIIDLYKVTNRETLLERPQQVLDEAKAFRLRNII